MEVDVEELVEEKVVTEKQKSIIVYNDDVNTFDWVIETFMKYLNHTEEQATQCAWIIHYKGKCQVKVGDYDTLKPLCEALLENGLRAKIE